MYNASDAMVDGGNLTVAANRKAGAEKFLDVMVSDTGCGITEEDKDRTSPLRGGFAKFIRDRDQIMEEFAAKRNMYLPSMADDALMGVARELAEQNLNDEQLYQKIRQTIYSAVISHEAGHSVGLMHNFGGSDDALNYFPQYWNLRDGDGDGHVSPRALVPITEDG